MTGYSLPMGLKYFLVKYKKSTRTLITFEEFTNTDDQIDALVNSYHFNREGFLNLEDDIEIVALMSQSVDSLKVTHGRYFAKSPKDLQPTLR
jgi:hypothetical protein